MKLPLWMFRWIHRRRLSRPRMRGTWLHSWLGDRLLDRALWKPEAGSLARAWLVGMPLTLLPFMPAQAFFACVLALLVRGNVLLCIALQFLSTPLTAPIHLPACYLVGEVLRGRTPSVVWHDVSHSPGNLLSGDAVGSLYLGAVVLGAVLGVGGFVAIRAFGPRTKVKAQPQPRPPAARPASLPAPH